MVWDRWLRHSSQKLEGQLVLRELPQRRVVGLASGLETLAFKFWSLDSKTGILINQTLLGSLYIIPNLLRYVLLKEINRRGVRVISKRHMSHIRHGIGHNPLANGHRCAGQPGVQLTRVLQQPQIKIDPVVESASGAVAVQLGQGGFWTTLPSILSTQIVIKVTLYPGSYSPNASGAASAARSIVRNIII